MKIVKRTEVCGICTATLWLIPTLTYFNLKMVNIISPSKEWVWWVGIPTMFLIWGLINWKIKK
jgi:hypothetical protein